MPRRIVLALASAFAAGCVTEPDLSVLDRIDLAKSHVERAPVFTQATGIAPGQELAVDAAVQIALANNPDIGQAIARVRQAHANLSRARSAFLPSLDANAGYTKWFENSSYVYFPAASGIKMPSNNVSSMARGNELYRTGLDANWNLFAGGRDWQNYHAAREREESFAFRSARVKQIVENSVRTAFYDALLARESIAIGQASVTFSSRELKDAKARYDVGRGLKTDVLTFETRKLDAQVQVTEAENAHRLARIALGELMALALPDTVKLAMPVHGATRWEKMAEQQVVGSAWKQRLDLDALRRDYAAAKRQVQAAKADFLPQVNATGSYAVSHRNSPEFRQDEDDLSVGLGVVWNLYRGGDTVAAIAAARHASAEAAEGFRKLKLQIRTEVSNALTNIKNARDRVGLAEKTVATAEETLSLLTERYRAGAITISQVTEGELRLTQARLDLLRAKIDLLTAQSELKLALGESQRSGANRASAKEAG